jgi:hypothetical protein
MPILYGWREPLADVWLLSCSKDADGEGAVVKNRRRPDVEGNCRFVQLST